MANRPIEHVYVNDTTYDVKDIYAERSENKASAFSAVPGDTKFPTEKLVKDNLDLKENAANKITSFTGITPTDTQYPSAKLVKDTIDQVVTDLGGSIDGIDFTPYERHANRVSVFQATPDDTHYPSEKLVKDNLDALNTGVSNVRTVVVSALPAIADASETVNYVLYTSGLALLYKKIEGAWVLISGSKAYVGDNLPSTGDIFTEYYIPNPTGDNYLHYRWADPVAADPEHGTEAVPGRFYAIGSDAYSKAEVDAILADYEVLSNKVTSITSTSTDTQYPSAKAVYTSLQSLQSALEGKVEDSTQVVSSVPAAVSADENVNYVVKQGTGALLYRKIDGVMKMIGGAMVKVVSELPEDGNGDPDGDEFTDYYVATTDPKIYLHYRWSDTLGDFYAVGADAYSKTQIDNKLSEITTNHSTDISGINDAVNGLGRAIESANADIDELRGDINEYSMSLVQNGDVYLIEMYENEDTENPVSTITLPQGTGGGGGTSGTTIMTVERITPTPLSVTPTDTIVLQVNYSSVDSDQETVDGSYVLKMGNAVVMTGAMVQGLNSFNVTNFCTVGSQKFTLTVTDDGGSMNTKSWTVQVVDVRIESAFSDRYTNATGKAVNVTYTPYGSVPKVVHFKLDGGDLPSVTTSASGILQSYSVPAQSHGAHLLEFWMTATVNGENLETDHIFKDIIWYDEASDDPVIGCIYRYDHYGLANVKQYNTFNIPYVVYDPRTSNPTVELRVDGNLVSELHLSTASNTWSYKSDVVATHILTITCRTTTVTLRVNVQELGYDIQPVTANLDFDFNPVGITNASSNRLWTDANNPDVKLTVSDNFDWNNGGYQVDSDGNQYFCVRSGTRAYISHKLFGTDPKQNGEEFKIIFKVSSVRNKDATFLTCLTGAANDKVGFKMQAHEATIYTSTGSLVTNYCEDDIIEFEYNINAIDLETDGATSFIMTYEDGVAARPLLYSNAEDFLLYQLNPVNITIGSDDCDVYIYRMKSYSSALTDSNILSNFIADARDSETMISRYERNQIYNENNALTPESVAAACPDLKIIKISCPHFTNDKKDYVRDTTVQCLHMNGDQVLDNWTMRYMYHAGQGTTSNRYGLAGRNIDIIGGFDGESQVVSKIPFDSTYITELTLGDGSKYYGQDAKVALTRTSEPNTWFNIKVNIASSENANNALLQKRYNQYIPYKTPAQRRNSKLKNSMEFVNCVIFLQENDPDVTTHREFDDTNWHFYALGNIGDSKKTDFTRVNDPTDQNEFVVEVSDNTLPNSTFDTGYYNADGSIRYPISMAEWTATNGYSEVTDSTLLNIKNLGLLYERSGNTYRKTTDTSIDSGKTYYMVNYVSPKYRSLYIDEYRYNVDKNEYDQISGWDASFEFRYDASGTKDGESMSGSEVKALQTRLKQVFRNMYEFVITSSDTDFVTHFGDWFITESPLYWYLFTERYTMIDNRAKNSFWHWGKTYITTAEAAELGDANINADGNQIYIVDDAAAAINDGYRFDLWDYDNDTGLGIDNNGELNMTYGHEDIDYKVDGDPSSGWIFNAADSVFWRRIRGLMGSQLRTMYQSRESLNCWSATSLINEFDAWQEQFPEELWRLDVERKYLRPYYVGNPVAGMGATADFLQNMMNGRKRYQRRQFERDQEIYIGTKYFGMNQCADSQAISFRCNTPQSAVVKPDYTIRIVPYSDMYLSVAYGNSSPQTVRAKAGVEYTFTTTLTTMDDTQILIYCAENIMALNDLSACYIRANNFSQAKRMKTLVIGSNTPGYANNFITALQISGGNAQDTQTLALETLDIRNCPNLTGSVNFSNCPDLKTLLAEGTSLSGVTFATNGKIQTAHLPATIAGLTLRNLNYLTDLELAGYDNLVTLVSEYCAMDPLSIVYAAQNSLQILRVLGINWQSYNTDLLNKIYAMSTSVLSGTWEVTGYIRQSEIDRFGTKWTDLDLIYNEDNIIPQQIVTYRNWDGTELARTLVDTGSNPPNPIDAGIITEIPTREPDAQYVYTYSGWDGLDQIVYSSTDVIAAFSTELREYEVSWYIHVGDLPLLTKKVTYGDEAIYDGETPTDNTAETVSHTYRVFRDWDKSTGCVTGNLSVYAQFDEATIPPVGKELSDMTDAERYAVRRNGLASSRYTVGDYFNVVQGYDPEFIDPNPYADGSYHPGYVKQQMLLENRWFDGTDYYDTGIKLFDANSPSFTLAIDYEFVLGNIAGATLASCVDTNTNVGFMLNFSLNTSTRTSSFSRITWGSNTHQRCGFCGQRNIIVLRYTKGSNNLMVYSFNGTSSSSYNIYDTDTARNLIVGPKAATHSQSLVFGGVVYNEAGYITGNLAKGWIHYAKVWYGDLGDDVCKQIVNWPHETMKCVYVGSNRQFVAGSNITRADAQFVFASAMPYMKAFSNTSATSESWETATLRQFIHDRIVKSLPKTLQSALQKVRIVTKAGSYTNLQVNTDDYMYLLSIREVYGDIGSGYFDPEQEAGYLSYYSSDFAKAQVYLPGAQLETRQSNVPGRRIFSQSTDPTRSGEQVKEGDIWIDTSYSYYYVYYFVSQDTVNKHSMLGGRVINNGTSTTQSYCRIPYDSNGSPGLWVQGYEYWMTRSPYYYNGSSNYDAYRYYRYRMNSTTYVSGTTSEPFVVGFSI